MARGAIPPLHDDNQDSARRAPKASKRRCVQSACVPCRKRKSKCDGGTPVCATCTAVYKTECSYDAESETRRSKTASASSSATPAGTKRDASAIATSSHVTASSADFIVNSIRKLPEEDVYDLISHIRKDPTTDIAVLIDSWRKTVTLSSNTTLEVESLETELSVLLGKPAVTFTGESRHFGHSASLGLVSEEENFSGGQPRSRGVHIGRRGTTWTNVTSDLVFVEKLLHLYFTWTHPFFVIFSRESFYRDFRDGRDKYCSSLLVNAICAYACHLTDDPCGHTDPSDFRTAGDHFFGEARRLLFEDESPSLATIQALCVMAQREPSAGRDSSGFGYMGRCIRMCIEMGLHLNNNASPELGLTPSEVEVRKVTFWGCFTVDTTWSICVGRITQLPRAAITIDKPILEEITGVPEAYPGTPYIPPGVVTTRLFLQEFTTLSELANDNNYMFYGPKERLTSSRLLDTYNKYQAWYRRVPPALAMDGIPQPEPQVLVLHMFYHNIIVHLFRPFLKVELLHSDVRPRDLCIEAANTVSRIIRTYRQFYSFRVAHLIIPHILLTSCVVHLLYSKDNETSYQNLVEGLRGLEDLHVCHYFGARSFRIIHTLAKTWNLPWPKELQSSKLVPKGYSDKDRGIIVSPPTDPLLIAPNTMTASGKLATPNMPYPPVGDLKRRESLSMFGGSGNLQLVTHSSTSRPGSVPTGRHNDSPVVGQTPTTYNNVSLSTYQYSQPMSTIPTNGPTAINAPTTDTAEALFWTPIPGMPGPILTRSHCQISPMGVDSVLQSTEMDRLGRDGFKISEDWQSSHINAFATRTTSDFVSPNNQAGANTYMISSSTTPYAQTNTDVTYQQPHPHHPGHQPQQQQEGYHQGWYPTHMN